MFAYCLNNPLVLSDTTGQFGILSFLGALAGGAIGGALTSTVSYLVDCAIEGKKVTASGLKHAAGSGAVSGLIGSMIGTINTKSIPSTIKYKARASTGLGIAMGIKSGVESEGLPLDKSATGLVSGIITGGSTFLGSQIDAYDSDFGFFGNMFTNFAATIFVGVPAEILYVSATTVSFGIDNCWRELDFMTGHTHIHGVKSSLPVGVPFAETSCATAALAD